VNSSRLVKILLLPALLAGTCAFETGGQEPAQPEMSGTTTPFTLKVERNEVPVRVVVRDAQGKPVRNLTKDDFRILDDGKPQVITQFSAEGAPASIAGAVAAPIPATAKAGAESKSSAGPKVADRFVAFYFDDLVMKFDEIARSRDAATKYLQTSLQPADRVAIYTSSGQHNLDFTADRDKLQEAISRLHPIGVFAKAGGECPDLSDYEAYMIDERKDREALDLATAKVIICYCGGNAQMCKDPSQIAQFAAQRRWAQAQAQVVFSLLGLEKSVRRLSILPGQRTVVFVSRGFISGAQLQMISEIIDRAVRAGVVVNGLDARGLYAMVPGGDASEAGSGIPPGLWPLMLRLQLAEAREDDDVLAEVADGTGGSFFHNNNDFDAGFRTVGGLAEFSYVMVFSPSNLKPNGKYHHLTVQLVGDAKASGLQVQARRGYFAPNAAQKSARAEQEDLAKGAKVSITDLSAPTKARNEYEKGQQAFQKDNLPEARQHLENAVSEYPCYARAQTNLGVTLELQGENAPAENAFRKAIECDAGFLEAHVQIGIFLNHQGRFAECAADLKEIIGNFPESWQLSYQLATAEYGLGQYQQAQQEYLRAESLSSEIPAEIHVRLADVYTQQGAHADAYAELQAYLRADPQGRFAQKAHEVMRHMEKSGVLKDSRPSQAPSPAHVDSVVTWPLPKLFKAIPELKGLEPVESQEELPGILQKVGENVRAYFESFPDTASVEGFSTARLGGLRTDPERGAQKFQYLALAHTHGGCAGLDEYRTNAKGERVEPRGLTGNYFITKGFVSTPLHFYPSCQTDSAFRYLGRQVIEKRQTHVVAFAQRSGVARTPVRMQIENISTLVLVQGIAWIDSSTYQILRMRTDLLPPKIEIGPTRVTTKIEFQEVHFKESSQALWLPREVVVSTDWKGCTYLDRHRYSNFKLFTVGTEEKARAPHGTPPGHDNPN